LREVYGIPLPDLPGNIWKSRSPLLVEMPLCALKDSGEPIAHVGPKKLGNRIRRSRYERLLWPRKSRWSSLADLFYSREDFRTLAVPDSFFWAYKPLRPVLWIWRWSRRVLCWRSE